MQDISKKLSYSAATKTGQDKHKHGLGEKHLEFLKHEKAWKKLHYQLFLPQEATSAIRQNNLILFELKFEKRISVRPPSSATYKFFHLLA